MSFDVICIYGIVGLAAGWLGFRWGAAWLRRRSGGCAGGCGCATKLGKKG